MSTLAVDLNYICSWDNALECFSGHLCLLWWYRQDEGEVIPYRAVSSCNHHLKLPRTSLELSINAIAVVMRNLMPIIRLFKVLPLGSARHTHNKPSLPIATGLVQLKHQYKDPF